LTTPLREALRLAAEHAPAYPVQERAIATARRRRVAAGLTAVAVIGALALIVPLTRTPVPVRPAAPTVTLPDRIGLPPFGARRDTDRPGMAAATVLFAGSGARFGGWIGEPTRYGLVGAADDYRTLNTGFHPGSGGTALLSPDGRSVAYSGNGRVVEVVTLADLRLRHLVGDDDGQVLTADPVAWSPDGRRLVVHGSTGPNDVLSLVDLAAGTWTRLAEASRGTSFPAVAFAADGRLAYQRGNEVWVLGVGGAQVSTFSLPVGSVLAGRGAWTPDGSALTVVPRNGSAWSTRYLDPGSGLTRVGPALPGLRDLAVRELLGWWPDGSALVSVHDERSARIVALTPGAAAATTVLTAPAKVTGVEVAAEVLASGRTRAGDPPGSLGPRFWHAFANFLLAAAAVSLGAWWLRRWTARRRSRRVKWS
jgi:hypothetical protein